MQVNKPVGLNQKVQYMLDEELGLLKLPTQDKVAHLTMKYFSLAGRIYLV
jgi:hypothetical protein